MCILGSAPALRRSGQSQNPVKSSLVPPTLSPTSLGRRCLKIPIVLGLRPGDTLCGAAVSRLAFESREGELVQFERHVRLSQHFQVAQYRLYGLGSTLWRMLSSSDAAFQRPLKQ